MKYFIFYFNYKIGNILELKYKKIQYGPPFSDITYGSGLFGCSDEINKRSVIFPF